MGLSELPAELLHKICMFCEAPDRLKLRRVCHLMRDVVDEHFMKRVVSYVGRRVEGIGHVSRPSHASSSACITLTTFRHFVRQDFDMIEHLTLNPLIARGVESLYFHADTPQVLGFDEWDKERRDQIQEIRMYGDRDVPCEYQCEHRECRLLYRNYDRETNRQLNGHSMLELKAMHERYRELVLDGASMMEESRQEECFQTLFKRCPRLDSVAISMRDDLLESSWQAVKEFREVMLAPLGDHHTSRIGYRPLQELLLALYETGKILKRLDVKTVSHQFFEPSTCTPLYHEAISGIRYLHIGITGAALQMDKADDDDEDHDDSEFDGMDDEAIWALLEARHEARREDPHQAHTRVVRSFEHGGLAAFLAAAKTLAALSIDLPRESAFLPEAVALEHVVGNTHWPHLTKVTLQNFRCRDVELTDFLQRHADTIQNLSLCYVTFTEGSTQSCFEPVAGKLPQLRRVKFRARFKAHGFSSAQEGDLYLSGGYSEYPLSKRADAPTRALQTYMIEGGQFPSWILALSRARMFWWHRYPRTHAEALSIHDQYLGRVEPASMEPDSNTSCDSDDSDDECVFPMARFCE